MALYRLNMKGLWKVSPSSEPMVERCIEAAEINEDNKWAKAFKRDRVNPNISRIVSENQIICKNSASEQITKCLSEEYSSLEEEQKRATDAVLREIISTDLDSKWSYVVQECSKDVALFTSIATNLNEASLEKFSNQVYDRSSDFLKTEFVSGYMKLFLPTYLKRRQSGYTLDLIVRAFKCYPLEFKTVFIPCLLKELEISSNILHDFVLTLNEEEKTDLLSSICNVKLKFEEFQYHLTSIYSIYRDSNVSPCIQSYILSNLEENCAFNCNNKNFGRLLLTFMQKCNNKHVYANTLERIITSHQSTFKRPCMNKLEVDFK